MLKRIIFFGIFLFLLYGSMNYSEFCFRKMRCLSDDEKKRLAIELVSSGKYNTHTSYFDDNNFGKTDRWEKILPYKNVDEFLEANQNCCTLFPNERRYGDELSPPTFFERLSGRYNFGVFVKARIKYLTGLVDENGINVGGHEIQRLREWSFRFGRCGDYCGDCGGD